MTVVEKVMNPGRDGTLAMWQMVAWKVIFASGCCPVAEEAVALMDTRMKLINDTLILPMDDKCLEVEMTLVPKVFRVFSFCLPYLFLPSVVFLHLLTRVFLLPVSGGVDERQERRQGGYGTPGASATSARAWLFHDS
jgi:hypothetical protein